MYDSYIRGKFIYLYIYKNNNIIVRGPNCHDHSNGDAVGLESGTAAKPRGELIWLKIVPPLFSIYHNTRDGAGGDWE